MNSPRMVDKKCHCCGVAIRVRAADVKRGWGKFCSKSCKAKKQEQRTGQYRSYQGSGIDRETYLHYAREYGGNPQFDGRGEYVGFTAGGFDNTEHQDHGRDGEA